MDFDKYKIQQNGVDAIVFCGKQPSRAIISFSSMNPGKYERWSWFYELHNQGSEDLYIILKDDSQRYYLGDDLEAFNLRHYRFFVDILRSNNIETHSVITLGSSMGGYAAIYYGFWLGVKGVIAINPQTTYSAARRHSLQNWERQIRATGAAWVDLDEFIFRFDHSPIVLLEHSSYSADQAAATSLIHAMTEKKINHYRGFIPGGHGGGELTLVKLQNQISLIYSLGGYT